MTTLSIELPEPLAARLEAIAREQNLTRAEVAREAITAYLTAESVENGMRPQTFFEAAKDLIGSLEGPGDLSTNPAHMEGFGES